MPAAAAPDTATALAEAFVLAAAGHAAAALDRCLTAAAVDGSAATWAEGAEILTVAGHAPEACALLSAARQAHPADGALAVAFGLACLDCDDTDAARAALAEGLALAPTLLSGLFALSSLLFRTGEGAAAVALWERAAAAPGGDARLVRAGAITLATHGAGLAAQAVLARDPAPHDAEHAHLAAAIRGEVRAEGAAPDYVRDLFDRFAPSYDTSLARIGNRGPVLIAGLVTAAGLAARSDLAILDAGCGTGLCAPVLRPRAGWLAGADLSPAMLAEARAAGQYDRLAEADLRALPLAALAAPGGGRFDLVVTCDVLVYLADLTVAFTALRAALAPAGVLLCTLEAAASQPYELRPSGRYAHSPDHVAAALAAAGLHAEAIEPVACLRFEFDSPVAGLTVIARDIPD